MLRCDTIFAYRFQQGFLPHANTNIPQVVQKQLIVMPHDMMNIKQQRNILWPKNTLLFIKCVKLIVFTFIPHPFCHHHLLFRYHLHLRYQVHPMDELGKDGPT